MLNRLIVPLMLIALSMPLIYQIVPRNRLYGFRTRYTLSSDQVWYRANKIGGIAMFASGIFWLALELLLPNIVPPTQRSYAVAHWFGIGLVMIALLVSTWLIYRKQN